MSIYKNDFKNHKQYQQSCRLLFLQVFYIGRLVNLLNIDENSTATVMTFSLLPLTH